ncbi:MAG: hypothetical protein B7X07_07355 [Actinobacteria bacterium 21-64-8]|nr:MAG: hypothetical protein B7X07_07355 [Actinobacteria bacterium 21-64-8]
MRGAVLAAVVLSSSVAGAKLSPGELPQTRARPLFTSLFQRDMAVLAGAIAANDASEAQRVFFLEQPYLTMKARQIADPALDYRDRLVALYRLDLSAYHQALYAHAHTTYLYARADAALARWIPPGACENAVGYWHEPGVRLVFRRNGVVESVAVDSLISWRGVWYVVHLGPNPRPRNVGTVDGFAKGPGTPGPGGGC